MKFMVRMKGRKMNALGEWEYQAFIDFVEEESGQDQIEFALVAALLALAAIASLKGLAADVLWLWQGLATNLAFSI